MEAGDHRTAALEFTAAWEASGKRYELVPLAGNAWRLGGARTDRARFWRAVYSAGLPSGTSDRYQLGSDLLESGVPTEALHCFQSVVADRPVDPAAHSACASAYRSAGRLDEAWRSAEQALSRDPHSGAILLTAAQIRHCQGRVADALALLDRALAARPEHAPTRLQRAMTRLLSEDFVGGWEDFEARNRPVIPSPTKEWMGGTISGSIAVLAEQGLGDLFQFLRFVPMLQERGATRIVVESHPAAVSLLQANGIEAARQGALPATQWAVPLLSLPHRLAIGENRQGDAVPYLAGTNPRPVNPTSKCRVGITWRGNPEFLDTFLRDFDPALLEPLTEAAGADWISLQFGEPLPMAASAAVEPPLGGDWLDTANRLATLDGVISVDTSIAHLAGAMGIPVLIMLPFAPDWRWLRTGSTSAWYPTATLARQSSSGDWASVIPQVHRWLAALPRRGASQL